MGCVETFGQQQPRLGADDYFAMPKNFHMGAVYVYFMLTAENDNSSNNMMNITFYKVGRR